jgi:hypothetical protein
MCYNTLIGHAILNQKTRLRKGLVSYFKNNGIIILKIVDPTHEEIAKTIEEKVNSSLRSPLERLLANKRLIMNANAIFNFLQGP